MGNIPCSSIVSASSLPVNKECTREVAMLTMVQINWNKNELSQHLKVYVNSEVQVCLSLRLQLTLFVLTQEESNELNNSPYRRANQRKSSNTIYSN